MHLPLTTAITQVLLVTLGGRPFAIPSGMIDCGSSACARKGLLEAYNQGSLDVPGGAVPLHYLGVAGGNAQRFAAGAKQACRRWWCAAAPNASPCTWTKRSATVKRWSKHIGPHPARLEGIAGRDHRRGDGEIVLIYNSGGAGRQRCVRERGVAASTADVDDLAPPGATTGSKTGRLPGRGG
ncbi:hypothetical protein ACU4GD_25060 [Cupriavidus basilensis]